MAAQEIRSPVEFFGPNVSNAVGVTSDFRPNVEHMFSGDGQDADDLPKASEGSDEPNEPAVPVPDDDEGEDPNPNPVPDDDDDDDDKTDAVLPPNRPSTSKAQKSRSSRK